MLLRFEGGVWSMIKLIKQATNEYPSPSRHSIRFVQNPHRSPSPPPRVLLIRPSQNKAGQTAGHYAVSYQAFDLSEWLFGQDGTGVGADDTIENSFGLGPYDGLQPDGGWEGGGGGGSDPLLLEGGG